MQETPGNGDPQILVRSDRKPALRAGRRNGRRPNTRFHPFDQRLLPAEALDLPDTEPSQSGDAGKRDQRGNRECGQGPRRARRGGLVHGICLMSWTGIILVLRWYMTQSEPARAITTRMMVKTSASIVQPPSDFPFMCRK
jgi:hypothetical protein